MFLHIGHRGAAGFAPENTIASIRKALDLAVDMIEIDTRKCATGEFVLHHDYTVNRTTNGTGYVHDLPLHTMQSLHTKGERIPTLQEALDCARGPVNIELKDKNGQELADMLKRYPKKTIANMLITSKHREELLTIKHAVPHINIGLVTLGLDPLVFHWGRKHGIKSVSVLYPFLRRKFVDGAHKNGLHVYAYPYGTRSRMSVRRLSELGVDGAFFNYPGQKPF